MKTISQIQKSPFQLIFFVIITLLLSISATAQEKEKPAWDFSQYKNEIGVLNLERVFSGTLSAFFIYKRRAKGVQLEKDRSVFTRYQLTLSGREESHEKDQFGVVESFSDNHFISLGIGQEWSRHYQDRFTLYYGLDFVFGYNYNNINTTSGRSFVFNNVRATIGRDDTLTANIPQFGVRPFVGARYHITRRFHISLESAFNLTYVYTNLKVKGSGSTEKNSGHLLTYGFDYLRFLTLGFYF